VGVVDSISGSPADKAGLTTGDMVETIRGVATRDMPLAYANMLLAGNRAPRSRSRCWDQAPGAKKITLTRVEIQYPRVNAKLLADEVGYVQAEAMGPATQEEVTAAVTSLEKQGAKRLILDLRHSSTGSPEEGIALANLFLDKGLITYLRGQTVPRKDFTADPAKAITKLPLVC